MPTEEEEENSAQPVWQSILLFGCKGMIEGIIVLLFLWLLLQVLFTKQHEGMTPPGDSGLVVLCFSLILGCIICWLKTRHKPLKDKNTVRTPPPPDSVGNVTVALSPALLSGTTITKLQYEELEGVVQDYPSAFESSTPSDEELTAVSEVNKSCFQMRRLSSPTSSLYKPMASGRCSLPSLPRLSLLSNTWKVLERHCTVAGDSYSFSEHRRLTIPNPRSPCALSPLQTQGLLQDETLFPNYVSNSRSETSDPFLHFTLTFSSTQNTLTVSLVGLTGVIHRLEEVTVQVRLPPLCPGPLDISAQDYNLSSGLYKKNLVINVGSLEGLKSCMLRLDIFMQDNPKTSLFEELEVCCSSLDWTPDRPVSCVIELRQVVDKSKKDTS
ncbi:uncharacterized protein LOC107752333 [Sinocyclocheilus rhinocerous]|uniref:uncharacterized protein LOC107752333 n=1 Tax=Sinocyclocheilus rhinocerous TaxID=307959 RepID=UPI0007B79D31|nr:PREDICTED: uncharacterized protein LOC107752333 [Sinocyclocheilus rhinocerous]